MNARQMERQADKLEGEQKAARKKILDCMQKGQMDNAKIHAETVIRQKRESTNVRRFGVKMTALSQKIEGAARTQQMSQTMSNTIPIMQKAMKNMEKAGIGANIAAFEKVFEDMDVKTGEIDDLLNNVYEGTIAQDEVASLLQEIQGEQAMGQNVGAVGTGVVANPNANAQANDVNEMQNKLD